MSERLFVDSAAFFAFASQTDKNYARAQVAAQRIGRIGAEMYTSNFVVAETHSLLLNRLNRAIAQQVLDRIYAGIAHIIRITERDETRARVIIHQYQDKEYSFFDASSFAVMERLHIRRAWTYDHHFGQYGWTLEQ